MTRWAKTCRFCKNIYHKRQKFRGWKVSRFAGFIRYVSFAIFSITTFVHSWFSNSTKHLWAFHESFVFLTWILLKTVISILRNGQEYIADTCVHISCFDSRMTMQSQEEKSYSWSESEMKQITNHFLVSFFCKLLNPLDSSPLLWNISSNIFHVVNFQWSKSLAGSLLIFRENRKSFLTIKLLLFTAFSIKM